MSDDNVVVLDVLTTINLPPERILNAALEADLAALVIVGYDKNGQYYFTAPESRPALKCPNPDCHKGVIHYGSDADGWEHFQCETCHGTGEMP
jgi:hypothetical protein